MKLYIILNFESLSYNYNIQIFLVSQESPVTINNQKKHLHLPSTSTPHPETTAVGMGFSLTQRLKLHRLKPCWHLLLWEVWSHWLPTGNRLKPKKISFGCHVLIGLSIPNTARVSLTMHLCTLNNEGLGHCSIEIMTFPASFACQGPGPPSNQFTHFNASKSDWSISCAASSRRDLQWVYVLRMKLREELLILKTFTLHIIHPATMLKVSSPLDAV